MGERAHLARRDLRQDHRHEVEEHLDVAGDQIVHRWSRAPIRHVHDIDVGHALEQFAGQMIGRTVAGRSEIEFARLFFASAISSCTPFAGTPGLTISTMGAVANNATGAKSLAGSKGSLL